MPRAPDGRYTLPSGSIVEAGEIIVPSQHNPPLNDLAEAMTDSLSREGRGAMRANLPMGGNRIVDAAPGVNPNDGVTVSQIQAITGVPIGFIGDWPAAAAPTGWLICAGQDVSRLDYAGLFALIGTTYGSSGSTTFKVPDLRGRVTAGLDVNAGGFASRLTSVNSKNIGAAGGVESVALTLAQMPKHSHDVSMASSGAHSHTLPLFRGTNEQSYGAPSVSRTPQWATYNTPTGGAHTHPLTEAEKGGNEAHPNVQPTIIMNKIIKAL